MAGISTGVNLLAGFKTLTILVSPTSDSHYNTGAIATGQHDTTVSLTGYGAITNTVVEFLPTNVNLSYTLTNAVTSLTNEINLTFNNGSYALYSGSYRIRVTAEDNVVYNTPYYNLDMVSFYFPIVASYSTSALTLGVGRSFTFSPDVDSWGVDLSDLTEFSEYSAGVLIITGAVSSAYLARVVKTNSFSNQGTFYIYLNDTIISGSYSSDSATFALRDSKGVTISTSFGGSVSLSSVSRVSFFDAVSASSSITVTGGGGTPSLQLEINGLGEVNWSYGLGGGSLSGSTGLINGTWCRDNGSAAVVRSGLYYRIKATHISGDTNAWQIVTESLTGSSSTARTKDTWFAQSPDSGQPYVRIKFLGLSSGTRTATVRISITNINDLTGADAFLSDFTFTTTK